MSSQDSISENPEVKNTKLNVGIVGCGWLGLHIAGHLGAHHHIFTTTTSAEKNAGLLALGYESTIITFGAEENITQHAWDVLHQLDVIIITVPFSKRNSVSTLHNRFEHLCQFIHGFNKQLFLLSSIGIYPETPIDIRENTIPNEELNTTMLAVEQLVQRAFPQVNILRLGGLMGGSRVFSNYNVEPTPQVVNHVHYQDICLVIEKMMAKNSVAKLYHVVAPMHPTKEEVLAYQKNNEHVSSENPFGKIVRSDAVQQELDYRFVHPDPRMF